MIGRVDRRAIADSKRTSKYDTYDFDVLENLIGHLGKIISTPHILSQVSDLAKLDGKGQVSTRLVLRNMITEMQEYFDTSLSVSADPLFSRLGLADSAIAKFCDRKLLVLTDDLPLHVALEQRGGESLNFTYLRDFETRS